MSDPKTEQAILNVIAVKQNLNRIAISLRIVGNEKLAEDLDWQASILDLAIQSLSNATEEPNKESRWNTLSPLF